MGTEESEIIKPALAKAREKGMQVFGPFPADGFFGAGKHEQFDGVLAMYHDQGLTPFKTLAFENGVNFTAGLPVVRTSPDHGTAFDIAGKNMADESSFRQAVYAAIDICRNRKMTEQLSSNILPNHSPPKGRRK
jgi:4-hydroxythreonine-4-phosphate dehydrogenase